MVQFKVVIGTKEGKCVQKELNEDQSQSLLDKKIGDSISGDLIGLQGYDLLITGGSDYCGIPMRKDVPGIARKKILTVVGTTGVKGFYGVKKGGKVITKKIKKGIRIRKTVCGNTIHQKTAQVNLKVTKEGSTPLAPKEEPEPKKE